MSFLGTNSVYAIECFTIVSWTYSQWFRKIRLLFCSLCITIGRYSYVLHRLRHSTKLPPPSIIQHFPTYRGLCRFLGVSSLFTPPPFDNLFTSVSIVAMTFFPHKISYAVTFFSGSHPLDSLWPYFDGSCVERNRLNVEWDLARFMSALAGYCFQHSSWIMTTDRLHRFASTCLWTLYLNNSLEESNFVDLRPENTFITF